MTAYPDRRGNVTTYTYDATFSQVTSITQLGGRVTADVYDANGDLVKSPDAMGDHDDDRDAHGGFTSVTKPRGIKERTPGLSRHLHVQRRWPGADHRDGAASTEVFTYDTRGRLTSVTDAQQHHHLRLRPARPPDLHDRPAQRAGANVYDAIGGLIATTDRLGRTMHFDFDLGRRLVETVNADGTILTRQFGPTGNLTEQTDELGRTYARACSMTATV